MKDMIVTQSYDEAYDDARVWADKMANRVGVAIERATEFGMTVFRVKFVPWDPARRFGRELRCEIVPPGSPRIERK